MHSLKFSSPLNCLPSSNSSSSSSHLSLNRITCCINFPKLPRLCLFSVPKASKTSVVIKKNTQKILQKIIETINKLHENDHGDYDESIYNSSNFNITTIKLYAISEAVSDRIEMHKNLGQQRDNWNTLLLNSINMITLTASTMSAIACCFDSDAPLLALKLSSLLCYFLPPLEYYL
ncbi:putative petal formation-expressed [Medicago truncatula]|uniref:Putative petal formation-expressed n=1 Tax=Medicago truncatula TaxID=3880 RepID=A0A396J3D0_MEDTR|nr:putative petal formation-expressed [Medicago truncatula]